MYVTTQTRAGLVDRLRGARRRASTTICSNRQQSPSARAARQAEKRNLAAPTAWRPAETHLARRSGSLAPRGKPQGHARGGQNTTALADRFLAGKELESINRALIDTITEARRREGCANGTVNRTLSL